MGKHKKKTDNSLLSRRVGILQVKAIKNSNTAKINAVGYVDEGYNFADERIDIGSKEIMNNGEKGLMISKDIFALFYKSNLSDVFLITNKKLPVLYASIMYQRPFTTGFLFNIYVNFEITTDTQKIKDAHDLLNHTFEGRYYVEIEIDEKRNELISLEKFTSYDEIVKQLITVIKNPAMDGIIQVELKKRDDERIKRLGGMTDYTIPKPTIIFKDLVDKYKNGNDLNL
jgi:hypothetical protein